MKRMLKYRINIKDTWKKIKSERKGKPKVTYDNEFFKKLSDDFSNRIKQRNYEYGRKSVEILKENLEGFDNFNVLEVGTGPGTLTIPLAKNVKKVVGVDISKMNIEHLKENLKENNIKNVEIINEDWDSIDIGRFDKFDLVVCSHFFWMVDDLEKHLEKMEYLSKKYCSIIQPCGRDNIVKEIYEKILDKPYMGEFEPDADYFAYVILREWGRLVEVRYFDYTIERNLEEEIRYVASFIGRFKEVDEKVKEKIKNYLIEKSEDGKFIVNNKVAVMWWECER
ncbi:class I SAM-dependent methyltransferase [Methanotorris formicicus]|uniref:Methyltransferase type 11 n=1 Tax=Methanotorris formicicus Mc-S-70 TaxID=647171 RepID=H1KWV8_9EURY|nr:class I SAM-dependent methyltransferase [Methanotorris formicicus]EHP89091.1 Methyltransferase type 11 [Methanotorris formicicus Mc-S-70]